MIADEDLQLVLEHQALHAIRCAMVSAFATGAHTSLGHIPRSDFAICLCDWRKSKNDCRIREVSDTTEVYALNYPFWGKVAVMLPSFA